MTIDTTYSEYVVTQIGEKFQQYDDKSLQVWVLIEAYMNQLMGLTAEIIELADVEFQDIPSITEFNTPTIPAKPTLAEYPESPGITESTPPDDIINQSEDLGIQGDLPESLTGLRPLSSSQWPSDPQLENVSTPNRPSVTKPTLATVREIEDVQFPDISTSINDVTAPTLDKYIEGAAYASGLLEKLKNTLYSIIDNGGQSLGETIEEEIFSRHEERVRRQIRASSNRVLAFEALNGMPTPSGARHAVAMELEDNYTYALALASNDTMVEQARLARDQFQHAISEANRLEAVLMEQHNAALQRAFEAWRGYLDLLIQTFDAQLRRIQQQLTVYQIQADIAKTRQEVSIMKADHDIKRNEHLLSIYQTDAQVAQTIVQAESTVTQAEISLNSQRLEEYRAKIQGVVQELQAYVAEVEAQIKAKGLDIDIRRVQVEEARVQTERVSNINEARARFHEAKARWVESINQSRAQLFDAEARSAANKNNNRTALFQAETGLYGNQVQSETARTGNQMQSYQIRTQQEQAKVTHLREQAAINMNNALRQHELILQPILKIFEAAAQWFASLVTAGNVGANMSASFGHSTSSSEGITEQHSYQEYCDPTCTG